MTAADYFEMRKAEGVKLTKAVAELAAICAVGERRVWEWVKGQPMPTYAAKLLLIWSACTPEQRRRWFG